MIKSNWYLWIFPVIAILVSAGLYVRYVQERGERIRITFESATGLQAEKTSVRFRGVEIGTVKEVYISDDTEVAVVEVLLRNGSEQFAVEGSKFWVVAPKVGFQGVSGLDTIFEGVYISVQPGRIGAAFQAEFKGQQPVTVLESTENTSTYLLEATSVESLNPGDFVTFRGLQIGRVSKVTLSKSAQRVIIQINIENRYAKLIRSNSVFWNKIGVQAKLGLFNSEVKVNSLDSIMHGGIEVFTPNNPGEAAKNRAQFPLNATPPKGFEKWNPDLDI